MPKRITTHTASRRPATAAAGGGLVSHSLLAMAQRAVEAIPARSAGRAETPGTTTTGDTHTWDDVWHGMQVVGDKLRQAAAGGARGRSEGWEALAGCLEGMFTLKCEAALALEGAPGDAGARQTVHGIHRCLDEALDIEVPGLSRAPDGPYTINGYALLGLVEYLASLDERGALHARRMKWKRRWNTTDWNRRWSGLVRDAHLLAVQYATNTPAPNAASAKPPIDAAVSQYGEAFEPEKLDGVPTITSTLSELATRFNFTNPTKFKAAILKANRHPYRRESRNKWTMRASDIPSGGRTVPK